MSQTQSSPCSKRFTIRSRFASASALNTCSTSIIHQTQCTERYRSIEKPATCLFTQPIER